MGYSGANEHVTGLVTLYMDQRYKTQRRFHVGLVVAVEIQPGISAHVNAAVLLL